MKIAHREIGPGRAPYVIAEIGVNHDGSVERALELTRAARGAGADAVKLQLFRADLLMSRGARLAAYQKSAGERDPVEMLRRLELSAEQMKPVVELAHELGLHAIVTCFSVELVAEAQTLGWDAYKTASPDIVHRPLLGALVGTGRPVIISTGASTIDEVKRALEWLRPARERTAVLQCVSSYPTSIEHAELGGVGALAGVFDGPIGYSDHTAEESTGAEAVRAGACVLEKHLTYGRGAAGPDHAASLEPAMFARYVRAARSAEYGVARREKAKRVLAIEEDVRRVSRQSIVTRGELPAGRVLRREDVTFKRPGTGLAPFRLDEVIGRRLMRAVEADVPVMEEMLERA